MFILLGARSQKNSWIRHILGLYLYSTGATRQQISVLNHLGLVVSYVTLAGRGGKKSKNTTDLLSASRDTSTPASMPAITTANPAEQHSPAHSSSSNQAFPQTHGESRLGGSGGVKSGTAARGPSGGVGGCVDGIHARASTEATSDVRGKRSDGVSRQGGGKPQAVGGGEEGGGGRASGRDGSRGGEIWNGKSRGEGDASGISEDRSGVRVDENHCESGARPQGNLNVVGSQVSRSMLICELT